MAIERILSSINNGLTRIINNNTAYLVTFTLTWGATLGFVGYQMVKGSNISNNYHNAYNQALNRYTTENQIKLLSKADEEQFFKDVLKDKDVTWRNGSRAKYENGKSVPLDTLTGWLKAYNKK